MVSASDSPEMQAAVDSVVDQAVAAALPGRAELAAGTVLKTLVVCELDADATEALLGRFGYRKMTMDDVARGAGIGKGYQKLFYLPEPHTDFVFSVIGEELGLLGCALVLTFFLVLLWRGLQVSSRCEDVFGCYLALGLTVLLVGQALVNMGVVVGLLPTKGLPLPFISYGGSSLISSLLAVGLIRYWRTRDKKPRAKLTLGSEKK